MDIPSQSVPDVYIHSTVIKLSPVRKVVPFITLKSNNVFNHMPLYSTTLKQLFIADGILQLNNLSLLSYFEIVAALNPSLSSMVTLNMMIPLCERPTRKASTKGRDRHGFQLHSSSRIYTYMWIVCNGRHAYMTRAPWSFVN